MAAIRDKIRAKTAGSLREGEQVQAVFGAQTASQYWMLLAYVIFFAMNKYRCVVVTDQRILVFDSGRWKTADPKELLREVNRGIRLGPGQGLWHVINLGGEELRVHKRFFKDLDAADDAMPAAPPSA
jgi:hypothetical protein